jgi:hypothetical protein
MKSKNVILYGVIAFAAVVGIAFFQGKTPKQGSVEGTIGGANRYQSQQISEQDVVTKDPQVQAFLQSDLFHKIQTNPELGRELANVDLLNAMKDRKFADVLADNKLALVVKDQARSQALGSLVAADGFLPMVKARKLEALLAAADQAGVRSVADFNRVVADQRFASVRENANWKVMADNLASVCASAEGRATLGNPAIVDQLVNNAAFDQLLIKGDFARLRGLEASRYLVEALQVKEFRMILDADQLQMRMKNQE